MQIQNTQSCTDAYMANMYNGKSIQKEAMQTCEHKYAKKYKSKHAKMYRLQQLKMCRRKDAKT